MRFSHFIDQLQLKAYACKNIRILFLYFVVMIFVFII